jgi:hypothetical protein
VHASGAMRQNMAIKLAVLISGSSSGDGGA